MREFSRWIVWGTAYIEVSRTSGIVLCRNRIRSSESKCLAQRHRDWNPRFSGLPTFPFTNKLWYCRQFWLINCLTSFSMMTILTSISGPTLTIFFALFSYISLFPPKDVSILYFSWEGYMAAHDITEIPITFTSSTKVVICH